MCAPLLNVAGEKPNKENDCSADKFELRDTSDESMAGIIKRKNNRSEQICEYFLLSTVDEYRECLEEKVKRQGGRVRRPVIQIELKATWEKEMDSLIKT